MTNLDGVLKNRDITLPKKVHIVKAIVFPVVMYGCESWTIKKAECWTIDVFKLWCWKRVPWTVKRSYQSILTKTNPDYSLKNWGWSWSSNTLARDAKSRLTGKDPDAGKDRMQEEKGTTEDQMVGWYHWLNEQESEQAPGNSKGQRSLACCSPWGPKESYTTEQLNKIHSAIFETVATFKYMSSSP